MKALPYPLSAWAIVDESYSVLNSHENWKMYNGLEFDENFMKSVSEQKARHAELFLSSSRRPRRLFLKCVGDVSESKKTPIALELDKARTEKVVSKKGRFHGKPVNWKSWRQFNATADANSRKRVYDDLVKKTPAIRPLIRAMFQQSWNTHKKYGVTPLRSYLESERITLSELKEIVQKLGSAVRKPFQAALQDYSREIKKAPPRVLRRLLLFPRKDFPTSGQDFCKVRSSGNANSTAEAFWLQYEEDSCRCRRSTEEDTFGGCILCSDSQ